MNFSLCTVSLPHVSGFPEDTIVNTFAFQMGGDPSPSVAIGDLGPALENFYNATQSTSVGLAGFLGSELSRSANAAVIRLYDVDGFLDGSPHGSPVATDTFTLGAVNSGENSLPAEVAVVLTLRSTGWATSAVEEPDGADAGSAVDRPRQRRSGRLYIGPLTRGALPSTMTVAARPATSFLTTLLDAAEGLVNEVNADGHNWAVWSRVDSAMRNVTDLQVDNAFDTQRRRGVDSTVRTTRTP